MAERVIPTAGSITWEPNAPEAVLVSDDHGRSALGLRAHFDDPDQRCIVLLWRGVRYASLGGVNDETIAGHRLYERGLRDLRWLGEVQQSELITVLEKQNRVHPQHQAALFADLVHHILPTKECTVEVVARHLSRTRLDGSTLEAAAAVLAKS